MEENTQKSGKKPELNIVCTNFIVQVREQQELTNGDGNKEKINELKEGANGQFTLEGGAVIEANAGNTECYYDENKAYRIKNGEIIEANREIMKKAKEAQEPKGNVRKVDTERGM